MSRGACFHRVSSHYRAVKIEKDRARLALEMASELMLIHDFIPAINKYDAIL
jgi:hypothetical protein